MSYEMPLAPQLADAIVKAWRAGEQPHALYDRTLGDLAVRLAQQGVTQTTAAYQADAMETGLAFHLAAEGFPLPSPQERARMLARHFPAIAALREEQAQANVSRGLEPERM